MPKKKTIIFQGVRSAKGAPRKDKVPTTMRREGKKQTREAG